MTNARVGIPRAIQFYQHYPLWRTFLERLGAEVVISPPTNRQIMTAGALVVADVTCLPVKVYAGHLCWLRDFGHVDYVFSPAIWNLERDAFHCTKLKCLPDLMEARVPSCPRLLVAEVDPLHRRLNADDAFRKVGERLVRSPAHIGRAWAEALKVDQEYNSLILRDQLTYPEALARLYGLESPGANLAAQERHSLRIGLVGHSYCLYDDYINHNLVQSLRNLGVDVVTSEMVPPPLAQRGVQRTTRQVRWFYELAVSGAAGYFLFDSDVDGVIAAMAFGCGPDSTMVETIARRAHALRRPFLNLVLDEHGTATGMLTRLEAFVDMLARQRSRLRTMTPDRPSRLLAACPASSGRKGSELPENPVVGIPSMGAATLAVKSLFRGIGARIEMGPPASKRTWDLGARNAPEFMCTPYKQLLGNMIEMLEAGANTLVYIDAVDQCRTSSYHQLMQDALRDLGYKFRFMIWSEVFQGGIFAMPRYLRRFAPEVGWRTIIREIVLALAKLRAIDDIERRIQYLRPREWVPGTADGFWQEARSRVDEARSRSVLRQVKADTFRKLDQVSCDPTRRPVQVGLTGEMFASLDPFYNQDIERQLSRAGAEVHRTLMLSNWLRAEMILAVLGLPRPRDVRRATLRYMRTDVAGPTLGDSVVGAQQGFDGMVELLPFTCVPHITALNVLPRVSREHDIPVLTFIFDEQTANAGMQARIEAFVDLLYRRREMRAARARPRLGQQRPTRLQLSASACPACPIVAECLPGDADDVPSCSQIGARARREGTPS